MFRLLNTLPLLFCGVTVLGMGATQAFAAPYILYSDLESGPNTGGENNNGVFVTVYGSGFGGSRGSSTVSVGGGQAIAYPVWTDTKVTFQLGPNAKTGNIVVATGNGSSNGLAFTVRSGNIYFASTDGSDSNSGSAASPFRTIRECKDALSPGDTCYVKSGVSQTGTEEYSASLVLNDSGTAAAPQALIAYPGASNVTIGSDSSGRGVYACSGLSSCPDGSYWVVAGFNIRGNTAVNIVATHNHKFVGNKIQCPDGDGASACVEGGYGSNVRLLGNEVTNAGVTNASKLYHAIYFTTDFNHVEVGWNWVHNNRACRGIQFHSTGGQPQFDLSVHDNLIHDIRCDGINFATVDPSRGPVSAYNNIIYNAGTGPGFPEGDSNYSCIYIPTLDGSGTVELYNNTLYNCGSGDNYGGAIAVDSSSAVKARVRNNLIRQDNGRPYFTSKTLMSKISGSNNLYFGNGSGPSQTTANVSSDPLFADLASRNFTLKTGSAAIDKGVNTGLATDRAGTRRPQGAAFDIGAYEFGSGSTQPEFSDCDLNRDTKTDANDVNVARNQALGSNACTGDLDANGRCDVVDLQRVINAAIGGTCRVGQ